MEGFGLGTNLPPGTFEKTVDMFEGQSGGLWDSEKDIDQCDKTPTSKEQKRSPIVHAAEDRRCCSIDSKVEKPVESLGQRRAKGADAVWPELCPKNVRKHEKTYV